jgi:1-deoxy-D-xylulose-5-phosphate reductoisomerase
MRSLTIIGSTGSIGRQTLEVVHQFSDELLVYGLSAQRNYKLLAEQTRRFRPKVIALGDSRYLSMLKEALGDWQGEILTGNDGIAQLSAGGNYDMLVSSAVGAAGITPTLNAIRAGKDVALANKETLVAAGSIIMPEAKQRGVKIYPVDSEHSAIFQCLEGRAVSDLRRIYLTASGGPFRKFSWADLEQVKPEQALAHPTWNMGGKVTIDSASLMNKGLEVIEAHWLFGVELEKIQVVIHPQSAIHSMIEFNDGSILAQLGPADMRLPIQYAVLYPQRLDNNFRRLDLFAMGHFDFEAPDLNRFPALSLAYEAGRIGGTMPAVMNAANEVAVQGFLDGRIRFVDIPRMVEWVMGQHQKEGWESKPDLEAIVQADHWARTQRDRWFGGIMK